MDSPMEDHCLGANITWVGGNIPHIIIILYWSNFDYLGVISVDQCKRESYNIVYLQMLR